MTATLSGLRLPLPPLPAWRPVRQDLVRRPVGDVAAAVRAALAAPGLRAAVRPGARVAVAVGSRGITELSTVVATLVAVLRDWGADPFLVPAMGSHGGATADGQRDVLASLDITEDIAPIRSTMDTVRLGTVLDGFPVYADSYAAEADLVIPVNRIKPHTDFRGEVESGLHKLLAIGLGKRTGAAALHAYPLRRFGEIIQAAGGYSCATLPVPFGLALVEDGTKQLSIVEAVPGGRIAAREPELLRLARDLLPRIPVPELDVLIVRELGKDVSGAGMDPNVTGRFVVPEIEPTTTVARLVVLDLTERTHGNAAGLGMADVTTERLVSRLDLAATYVNHLTTHVLAGAKLPMVAATDRDAVAAAVTSLPYRDPATLRIACVRNTVALSTMLVSTPLADAHPDVLEPVGPPVAPTFGADGTLLTPC